MSANQTRVASPAGPRLQSAVPRRRRTGQGLRSYGLLLKGVVVKTYGVTDPDHPYKLGFAHDLPVAAYCDVLTYSGRSVVRWRLLKNVLVSQAWGGCHSGTNWSPRPTTINISGDKLDGEYRGMSPSDFDGDHVLVGFLNDSLNEPVILRSLPHPSLETGNELSRGGGEDLRPLVYPLGTQRPTFSEKFRGSGWSVDQAGELYWNTIYAYGDEDLGEKAVEPTPSVWDVGAGIDRGHQQHILPDDGEFRIFWFFRDRLVDPFSGSADPSVAALEYNRYRVNFRFNNRDYAGSPLEGVAPAFLVGVDDDGGGPFQTAFQSNGYGADTHFRIGDGAVHVAIVEELRALYLDLKAKLDAFDNHVHLAGTITAPSGGGACSGASDGPNPQIGAPDWENAIESSAVSIPSAHP